MIEAARNAFLSLKGSRRLYICGLSMGALLGIHLAAKSWVREGLPDLSALALLAPAIEFSGLTWIYTQVVGRLPAVPFIIGKGSRDIRKVAQVPDGSYSAIPMRWGAELRALSREALVLARRVHAPALILHGGLDRTVAPAGARRLAKQLASSKVELHILPGSGHVLPLDAEWVEVCSRVVRFFQGEK